MSIQNLIDAWLDGDFDADSRMRNTYSDREWRRLLVDGPQVTEAA